MHVIITEFMDEDALIGFALGTDITYDTTLVDDRPRLLALTPKADALIVRNRTQVDTALLDAAPQLRAIGRLGVGLDNIDMAACEARGIPVFPATGANTLSVAEYVITAALALRRTAFASKAAMIAGEWPRNALMGSEISGATLGLVGYGQIARATATRARALGMKIAAHDPILPPNDPAWEGAENLTLPDLLARADVLSLHVPLTPETQGMLNATALAAMKPGAILVNTARGGIVDEAALADALRAGHLGGAALDVFAVEPLTAEAAQVFAGTPNLILTPHIAGVTQEANTRVSTLTVAQVRKALEC